jgi:hypothetical protein
MTRTNFEFKHEKKTVKSIFSKYRLYKFRLQYTYNLVFNNKEISKKELNEWKTFIQMIDHILEYMNHENASIINNVYIKEKDYRDLGYSTTTFYKKYHAAINEFLEYI